MSSTATSAPPLGFGHLYQGVVISENRVSRRLALQSLAAGLGASGAWAQGAEVADHPIVRHLHEGAERKPAAGGLPRLLDEHQFQTLSALAEIVVPGAKATESDVFIDTLLAVESTETKRRFLSALGAIEGAAIAEHRKPFLDLTTAEQTALLTAISEQATGRDLARDVPSGNGTEAPEPTTTLRDHFDHLKGWVSGAYYSSEAGMKELGWTGVAFFESFPACTHTEGHR